MSFKGYIDYHCNTSQLVCRS